MLSTSRRSISSRFNRTLPGRAAVALVLLAACNAYDEQLLARVSSAPDVAADSGMAAVATATHAVSVEAVAGKGTGRAGRADFGGRSSAGGNGSRSGGAAAGHGGAGASGKAAAGSGGMRAAASGSSGVSSVGCTASEAVDCCPDDPAKQAPGACGCGVPDLDSDSDSVEDCKDNAPFGWQRAVTVDGAQIADTLANFVLLVRITDTHLKQFAESDGSDIYFAAADKSTLLDFEIESYAADSGALVAWVRVPSLTAGVDAVVYLGYDDGKVNRSAAAGVWSAYKHVWHLSQDPSAGGGAVKDATGRSHGTAQGGMNSAARVAAVAGDGLSFDGKDDAVTYTNDVTGTGPGTLSGWVNQAADSGDNGASIISFGSGAANQSRFLLSVAEQQKLKVGFYGNDKQPATVLPRGAWKHVAWVWGDNQSTVYVDGASVLGPVSHTGANTQGNAGSIGGSTFGYNFFMTGQLDEVRVATEVRSAAWVKTEFNNQRPGATFIKTLGEPRAAPNH